MNPWRGALLGGLIYGLPYAVWLLGGLEPGPTIPNLRPAHTVFLWTQAIALAMLLPALSAQTLARRAGALLVLLAVPWPLLVLVASTHSLPALYVAKTQGAMALLAIALALLCHLGARVDLPWRPRLQAATQGLALLAAAIGLGPADSGSWL